MDGKNGFLEEDLLEKVSGGVSETADEPGSTFTGPCPFCKGHMTRVGRKYESYICDACGAKFGVRTGVSGKKMLFHTN